MNDPSLRGQRVLVTGATDGIGLEAVRLLAGEGARVIVHGRRAERVRAVADECGAAGALVADLASLREVRRLADELARDEPLDVLVNNAGLGAGPDVKLREVSEEGFELRWAVNFLAPFLLTETLLARRPPAAIVNVASLGQRAIDFDDLAFERGYDGWAAYSRSKLALIAWTFELAARTPPVAAGCLHPGTFLATKMVTEVGVRPQGDPSSGGRAVVDLARKTLAGPARGEFFNVDRPARALDQAYDPRAQRRLVQVAREAVGLG